MNPFVDQDFTPRSRCSVAAAILGAGALGAGASIYGASKAADAQTTAANNATSAQLSMFNTAKGIAQPFVDAGSSVIPNLKGLIDTQDPNSPLSALLRLVTPGVDQTKTLEATPGFQFANTYGQKAVDNSLAARGLAGPGGALAKGGATFAEGLAGTQFSSIVSALLSSLTGGAGTIQNLVNTGANASAGVGSNAITTGGQVGSNIIGAGNAQAGAATATGNAIGGFGNSISSAAILQKLLGSGGGGSGGGIYTGDPTVPGWTSAGAPAQAASNYIN